MATAAFVMGLCLLAFAFVIVVLKPGADDSKGAPPDAFMPPESVISPATNRYHAWTPGPPERPVTLSPATDVSPPELRDCRAFERVSDNGVILDISPDGREAMFHHGDASITIYDVASGAPLVTWNDICPPEWIETIGPECAFSCASRRLFIGWHENGDPPQDRYVNVLIDLKKREVTRLYEADDSIDSIAVAAMSANGRLAAGLLFHSDFFPSFDLESPVEGSLENPAFIESYEFFRTPGDFWTVTAMSNDGRSFAFGRGNGEVAVWCLAGGPLEFRDDAVSLEDIFYRERANVCGDAYPVNLSFDETGAFLLVAGDDCGLTVADLAANDFEVLKPFAERIDGVEGADVLRCKWLNNRSEAIITGMLPDPCFLLVNLDDSAILREWKATDYIVNHADVSPTGEFALVYRDKGETRVFPLLSREN